jgi:hypothetical protein
MTATKLSFGWRLIRSLKLLACKPLHKLFDSQFGCLTYDCLLCSADQLGVLGLVCAYILAKSLLQKLSVLRKLWVTDKRMGLGQPQLVPEAQDHVYAAAAMRSNHQQP